MKHRLAALVGVAAALLIASPAHAADTVCPTWTLHSITGAEWGQAAQGSVVQDARTVDLTKPENGGTEFLATDLNASGAVTVTYELSDDADHAAGAIRLFAYESQTPDTLAAAPDAVAVADATSGVLTLPALEHIGAIGLVYDASNSAAGTVTFTDLTIDSAAVSFTDCPQPPASASASATATAGPSTSGASAAAAGAGGSLPVTGAGVNAMAVAGGVLIVGGITALLWLRSRRNRFIA